MDDGWIVMLFWQRNEDAIGLVRDEYIEDAHVETSEERTKVSAYRQTGERKWFDRRKMIHYGEIAAGLCAVILLVFGLYKSELIPFIWDGGGVFETVGLDDETTKESDITGETKESGSEQMSGSEESERETAGMVENTEGELPEIIWTEELASVDKGEISSSGLDEMYRVISRTFLLQLEAAEETDIFAFVVSCKEEYCDGEKRERINQLAELYAAACRKRSEVRQQRYEALKDSGMSSKEAFARIYTDPLFVEWREKTIAADRAWKMARMQAQYETQRETLDRFEKMGFTLLYDAAAAEYQEYLAAVGGLGVMFGTKEQILALDRQEFRGKYWIRGAAENAEDYVFTDEYTGHEIYLSEGNNLTDPLIAAYEQADGQELKVEVQMASYGETLVKDEKHKAVLTYMGISQAEYEARCGDSEFLQQYLAAKKHVTSNRDYYEEVIQRLLKAEELAEEWDCGSSVLANLTYERALELVVNKEIAYIELAD